MVSNDTEMPTCATCGHWEKYPNDRWGVCRAIPDNSEATASARAIASDTSYPGDAWLLTKDDFGCVLWTASDSDDVEVFDDAPG